MNEDRYGGECFLKRIESIYIGEVKLPRNILLGEACQWNNNVQVVENELAVKACKT